MASGNFTSIRLLHYAAKARTSIGVVLQYSRDIGKLHEWEWPTTAEARICPSELRDHRKSHSMLGPCCLCPLAYPNGPGFVEAAMYMVPTGHLMGEYVASCATGGCDYFVFMERIYGRNGLVKYYPLREPGEQAPPLVMHPSEESHGILPRAAGTSRALKRSYAMLDVTEDIIECRAPKKHHSQRKTISRQLAKLDDRNLPGITRNEFQRLFSKCACGLVTTRRTFYEHKCQAYLIDLTSDSD